MAVQDRTKERRKEGKGNELKRNKIFTEYERKRHPHHVTVGFFDKKQDKKSKKKGSELGEKGGRKGRGGEKERRAAAKNH